MDLKDGWIKKLIFNELEANCFHNHFALTIYGKSDAKCNARYCIVISPVLRSIPFKPS